MKLNYPEAQHVRSLLMKVTLGEIMTAPVISIFEDEEFSLVEEKLRLNRIRHLPVVAREDNELVGIVTQRDLYRLQSPRKDTDGNWFYDKESLDVHILRRVMTQPVISLTPDDFAGSAIMVMVDNKFGCVPIVDAFKNLQGIVTQYDILRISAEILKGKS